MNMKKLMTTTDSWGLLGFQNLVLVAVAGLKALLAG